MSRVMWQFGKRQWFFLAALALGAVYGVCFLETQTLKGLSGGFAHAFPAEFSARALFFALLFLPLRFFSLWEGRECAPAFLPLRTVRMLCGGAV